MSAPIAALGLFAVALSLQRLVPGAVATPTVIARGVAWFAVSGAASGLLLIPSALRAGQGWFVVTELIAAGWVVVLGLGRRRWGTLHRNLVRQRTVTVVLLTLEVAWLASAMLLIEQLTGDGQRWLLFAVLFLVAVTAMLRGEWLRLPASVAAAAVALLGLMVASARLLRPEAYVSADVPPEWVPSLFVSLVGLGLARETTGIASRHLVFEPAGQPDARGAAIVHAGMRVAFVTILVAVGAMHPAGRDTGHQAGLVATLAAFDGFGPARYWSEVVLWLVLILAVTAWTRALADAGLAIVHRRSLLARSATVAVVVAGTAMVAVRFTTLRPIWAEAVDLVFGGTLGWAVVRGACNPLQGWIIGLVVAAVAQPWVGQWLPGVVVAAATGALASAMSAGRRAEP